MVRQTTDTFGAVDIMMNNAGIRHVAPIEEFPDEKWYAMIAINLSSAVHAAKLVLSCMSECGWGRMINVASVHALVASPNKAPNVAAKRNETRRRLVLTTEDMVRRRP